MKRQSWFLIAALTVVCFVALTWASPRAVGALQVQPAQVDILEPSPDPATWQYQPARVRIRIGGAVRWTNKGTHDHTVTADDNSFTAVLEPGESFEHTFFERGNFPYHDTLNPTMVGRVVIQLIPTPTATGIPPTATATTAPTQTPIIITATPPPTQTPMVATATAQPPTQTPVVITVIATLTQPLPTLTTQPTETNTPTATTVFTATPTPTLLSSNLLSPNPTLALVVFGIILLGALALVAFIVQMRVMR